MPPIVLLSISVLTPALVALVSLAVPRRQVALRVMLAAAAPATSFGLLLLYALRPDAPILALASWMPDLHLEWAFLPDRLGLFFGLLVAGFGVLVVLYARAYFGRNADQLYRFYPTLLLFMTAMLGLVLADSFVLMLLFWELTSISSYLLIGWERDDPGAVQKALQAFVITGAGGLAVMTGLVLLGTHTGSWSFSALLAGSLPLDGRTSTALVLIFAGAAAKSAQWPLHFWLPGAMAAPTPVSAYLHSATMVKAGVYLVGRLWPVLGALTLWPQMIIGIGALTMVLGAFLALRRSDLKLIFAYTTVSQLGLLMTMYGLAGLRYEGEPNLLWDVTQVLNHALYKAPLFLLAGAIGHEIHTRELPQMRGLARRGGRQAIMAVLLVLAAYALAAGPFTLSFTAKELFLYQVYHAVQVVHHPAIYLLAAAAVATGAFNVAIFVRLARVLLGRQDVPPHPRSMPPSTDEPAKFVAHREAGDGAAQHDAYSEEDVDIDVPDRLFWTSMLWLPAAAVLVFQYVAGIIPGAFAAIFGWLERPESLNYTFNARSRLPMTWDAIAHPAVPLYMSLAAMVLGVALGYARVLTQVGSDVHERLFPAFYRLVVDGGARVFSVFQTGYLRTYITLYFAAIIALFAFSVRGISGYIEGGAAAELRDAALLPAYLLVSLMCLAALLMPVVTNRAARIMVLGVAGAGATSLFYLYHAPDLALTQISIEVVSLILFLLVLALLPAAPPQALTRVAPRLALSIGVGAVAGLLTLAATLDQRPPRVHPLQDGQRLTQLGDYFLRNSYVGRDTLGLRPADVYGGVVDRGAAHPHSFNTHPLEAIDHAPHAPEPEHAVNLHKGGGGANVVNVVLVDFRGFDTLGEISVLALAALGVWTLFRRQRGEDDDSAPATEQSFTSPAPPGTRMSTTVLLQAARLLVPLAMIVSAFFFFKGHQMPGGGFVGGLVAAVALILYRMCAGGDALRRLMLIPERTLIATGLLLAAGTGAAALLARLPFLTSNNGYLPLPSGEAFHWATVLFFDAGVFLVVVGVTVGMVDVLARELELRRQSIP